MGSRGSKGEGMTTPFLSKQEKVMTPSLLRRPRSFVRDFIVHDVQPNHVFGQ